MSILKIGQYTNLLSRKKVLEQTACAPMNLMMSAALNLKRSVMATRR